MQSASNALQVCSGVQIEIAAHPSTIPGAELTRWGLCIGFCQIYLKGKPSLSKRSSDAHQQTHNGPVPSSCSLLFTFIWDHSPSKSSAGSSSNSTKCAL